MKFSICLTKIIQEDRLRFSYVTYQKYQKKQQIYRFSLNLILKFYLLVLITFQTKIKNFLKQSSVNYFNCQKGKIRYTDLSFQQRIFIGKYTSIQEDEFAGSLLTIHYLSINCIAIMIYRQKLIQSSAYSIIICLELKETKK